MTPLEQEAARVVTVEAAQHYRNTRAPAQEHRSAEEGG
jgi:hypothetical protein